MKHTISKELIHFIDSSPSCFHAVKFMKDLLLQEHFIQLRENTKWHIQRGGRYFVVRNGSAIIAFTVPQQDFTGMRIMASHSDSPSFKIKENPELDEENHYILLNVEGYGGMVCSPWVKLRILSPAQIFLKKTKPEILNPCS